MLITADQVSALTGQTYEGIELNRVNAAIEDVSASIEVFLAIRRIAVPVPTPAAIVTVARMEVRRVLNSEPGVSTERLADLSSGYAYGGAAYDLSPGAQSALKRYVRSLRGPLSSIQLVRPENWDEIPPTTPTGLTVTFVGPISIGLEWQAIGDVAGYRVYEDTTLVADVSWPCALIEGLAPGTSHTYAVRAYDGLENLSPLSAPVTGVTTA